jgi:hypothetical protein
MEEKKTAWKPYDGKFRLMWYRNTNNYFVLSPHKINLPLVMDPHKLFGTGSCN